MLLSVVIPLGPGEREEEPLLRALRGLPDGSEVLLLGAPVDRAPPPGWPPALAFRPLPIGGRRAEQMNGGAAAAVGRWLWFVHADTRLGPDALPALSRTLARPEAAVSWFDLRFRADGPPLTRLNALGANLRSAWLGLPFGDQALLMPADTFRALGGFDEAAPFGEDHLLVWAAHGQGTPVRRAGGTVSTSARKYARGGWAGVTLLHVWLTLRQGFGAWRANRAGRGRAAGGRGAPPRTGRT